uniref:Phostensin n=1 Tax=Neogobius melanostomus TaxID=47308 RepID=A0A8C6T6G6_9GOBI
MSVSSLPEWKQLLLERKRRDEEAREQRERQEEQKLANMPAWKRGIIQRRKAKQESPGEGCPVEARSRQTDSATRTVRLLSIWEATYPRAPILEYNANRHGTTSSQQKEEKVRERQPKTSVEAAKNSDRAFLNNGSGSLDAKASTRMPAMGVQSAPLEIQIPRTVFYVAEELVEKQKPVEDWEGGREMESGDSWKVRKPVSRVESLKEKIRQQQQGNTREKEAKVEDHKVEAACNAAAMATMAETEQEGESQIGQSAVAVEKEVEEVALQSAVQADSVTREVSVSKDSPQLPDSKSEAAEREEVIESGGEAATESTRQESDSSEEDEKDENDPVNQEETLKEEDYTEDDLKELTVNLESEESLSPSPPDPNSLEDMKDAVSSPRMSPKRFNSPDQTIEINSAMLRCQSPENALKILDLAPTPVSSPCSPSPAQSPSNSPSPSPTPTALFTIKSASGGQVKRGATITITPKKPQVQGSTATATRTTSPSQNPSTTAKAEPAKKKYPKVEDIEVIGGYLNLDKSCLVKNKGKPKKVCFDFDLKALYFYY